MREPAYGEPQTVPPGFVWYRGTSVWSLHGEDKWLMEEAELVDQVVERFAAYKPYID
jgi:hypothetical protein